MQLNKLLFTLFHHNINYNDEKLPVNTHHLLSLSQKIVGNDFNTIKDIFQKIIIDKTNGLQNNEVTLTLTGGMDSRIILAFLLKSGIKPNCLVFGNPNSRDVVYAKKIAEKFDLPFHNVSQQNPTKEWYYKWVVETIQCDKGNAHIHRAHRTAAIAEHAEKYRPKVLFTGHMGGEGLRGLTYNNYFASSFFQSVNEGKEKPLVAAKRVLDEYFIKQENIDYEQLMKDIMNLPWMKYEREVNKFYFLYDLVARIHHMQDIRLYNSYIPTVVPVFMQKDYLEALFNSPYSFVSKTNSLFRRLKNPEFYCKMIKEIYPPLLDFPFVNGFTPREYLKGMCYYVPVKLFRDYTNKSKFPPNFSYGKWYVDFVKENANNISFEIWEFYDKKRYMKALEEHEHRKDEGYWHKFSNPIYFDLIEKYKKGIL